jgi:hypothetical protein
MALMAAQLESTKAIAIKRTILEAALELIASDWNILAIVPTPCIVVLSFSYKAFRENELYSQGRIARVLNSLVVP